MKKRLTYIWWILILGVSLVGAFVPGGKFATNFTTSGNVSTGFPSFLLPVCVAILLWLYERLRNKQRKASMPFVDELFNAGLIVCLVLLVVMVVFNFDSGLVSNIL